MTRTLRLRILACAVLYGVVVLPFAQAEVVNFGTFNMEFVEIGDPGNAADTTGNPNPAGAVSYTYNLGKFEVSRDMIDKANAAGGLGITLEDMTAFGGNGVNRPATGVSWNEAARFVNWLNTSQGYSPAYKFAQQPGEVGYSANANIELWTAGDLGFNASNLFRNSLAQFVLPSVDEWYKAAYYDPLTDTYFNFPNGSDTAPTAVASGTTAGTAVYDQDTFQGPADIMEAGGLSPFGIMALGGNVSEFEETEFDLSNDSVSSNRGSRGGPWYLLASGLNQLSSSERSQGIPTSEYLNVGFRVASVSSAVPEPSSLILGSVLGVCGLWWGRRLKK